ncbi:MAG: aminotransferase class I/II-fold pyridoxal phosphate-dependent enzyme [Phycisphaerae bacterium]|nr:aminotransferase class I/II-fold pyridoxal phosphate-dependent enzyme [Phycisphaerae bacterium]
MNLGERLSQRARSIEFSGIRKAYELASRLKDPIDLSIGQPDYDAPDTVKNAAIEAIRAGHNRYTLTAGLPALRELTRAQLKAELYWDANVLITSGVSGGLLLALSALLDPGDEVVFADPYFVSYVQLVRMVGGKPVAVPSYPDFRFPADAIRAAITPRTRALILNSPGNPTGCVLSTDDVRAAADIARQHDLAIISDEIYNELCYDAPNPCPATFAPEHTILLRGHGKSFGVTGWRLGYLAAAGTFVDEIVRLQQYTYVCAPSMAQHGILAARAADVAGHRRDYAKKRDLVCELLAGTFEFVRPSGGFYVFPRVPRGFAGGAAFVEAAANRSVLVIPGNVFSQQDSHFRISYATTDDKLRRGCAALCETARAGSR